MCIHMDKEIPNKYPWGILLTIVPIRLSTSFNLPTERKYPKVVCYISIASGQTAAHFLSCGTTRFSSTFFGYLDIFRGSATDCYALALRSLSESEGNRCLFYIRSDVATFRKHIWRKWNYYYLIITWTFTFIHANLQSVWRYLCF